MKYDSYTGNRKLLERQLSEYLQRPKEKEPKEDKPIDFLQNKKMEAINPMLLKKIERDIITNAPSTENPERRSFHERYTEMKSLFKNGK